LYTARELEYQLRDSGAEAIVILENFAHVLQEVLARTPIRHIVVTSLGELLGLKGLLVNLLVRKLKKMVPAYELPGAISFKNALNEGRDKPLDTPALGHDDIAFLQYTGGTTGVSKGAMLLHRNVIAALLQYKAWLSPLMREERAVIIEGYGLTETAPSATANPLNVTTFTGAIGVPMPSTEVVLRDDDNRDLPLGQAGEICIRGPQVMAGYWQRPAETAEVLGKDGFL